MAYIFISYATADRTFALRLEASLKLLGHGVWIDQWEIGVGDSPWRKIGEGIAQAEAVVVVLSSHSTVSGWVEQELQIVYSYEMAQRQTMILPVVIEQCQIPTFLQARRFADFRLGYDIGLAYLAIALYQRTIKGTLTQDTYSSLPFGSFQGQQIWYTDSMIKHAPRLSEVSVEIGLPYIGKIAGMWRPDEKEQSAAWELYVELITRVSVVELQPGEGLLRESLTSLYVIFTTTRDILRTYGPSIARPKGEGEVSFGSLALQVINFSLRPVLATWHPLLIDYEHTRDPSVSAYAHERPWERSAELRQVLSETQHVLRAYAHILAQVADVPQLSTI